MVIFETSYKMKEKEADGMPFWHTHCTAKRFRESSYGVRYYFCYLPLP